jgi:hypothetical protein
VVRTKFLAIANGVCAVVAIVLLESPAVPQNFPNDRLDYRDRFIGKTIDRVLTVRDVLMDLPRVAEMPSNRSRARIAAAGGK